MASWHRIYCINKDERLSPYERILYVGGLKGQRVLAALLALRDHPWQGKKLKGEMDGYYSWRVWPYRIVCTIEKKIITVTVFAIGQRKDVYRRL